MPHPDAGRFLTVAQVAEELSTSEVQIVAMLRRGDIRGIKLGGRRQGRIEQIELEPYTYRCYEEGDARQAGQ